MRILNWFRDKGLDFLGDAIVRVARVEDLMHSGMNETQATAAMEADWKSGIRRWPPLEHATPGPALDLPVALPKPSTRRGRRSA